MVDKEEERGAAGKPAEDRDRERIDGGSRGG